MITKDKISTPFHFSCTPIDSIDYPRSSLRQKKLKRFFPLVLGSISYSAISQHLLRNHSADNKVAFTRSYKAPIDAKSYLAERLDRIIQDVSAVSNIEAADLMKRLAQGESLSQAAETDSDSLLYQLLAQANENMNALVTAGSVSEGDAAVFKTDYAAGVSKLLSVNE